MSELERLVECIHTIGFQCTRCGQCCQSVAHDPHLVMVSPREIRSMMRGSGKEWDELVEPFPVFIDSSHESSYTFEWCMRRTGGHCSFVDRHQCLIYPVRPWICRTYPFMLNGSQLEISECLGLGKPMHPKAAFTLAVHLIQRRSEERIEEVLVKQNFDKMELLPRTRYVIDGEGAKIINQ